MSNLRSKPEPIFSAGYTYYNRTFDDITDLFLYACMHGDYMLVYSLLKQGQVKADVCNRMGKSALQLAIEKEHLEVVRILLDTIPYEQFRDAILLAIYLGHTKIADFILNHPTYKTFQDGFLDPRDPQAYDDSKFSSDITPLILAAQYNRVLIVHHLLLKGQRIPKPHQTMCSCKDCSASDSFRQAQIRLSAYRGLASDVYIALAYPDPILQAFELSDELRNLAKIEHHFCEEYKKLIRQLSIFVARLLDNVRGHEELEILLNKTGRPNEEKYEILSRFDLAIQYREKPFVSHSNCQQKLTTEWYANLSMIKNVNLFQRVLFYLAYIICFPFVALTFYFFPHSKIGALCDQPNLKFKTYMASYFIFIGLIIASSSFFSDHLQKTQFLSDYNSTIYRKYIELIYRNVRLKNAVIGIDENAMNSTMDAVINCDLSLRFMTPNPFQIVIFIWVIGFLWNELKQIFFNGLNVYLKIPSNYVDCSMNILYIFYFIFLYSSMIITRLAMNTFHSEDYWMNLARFNDMSDVDQQYYIWKTRHTLYWLNADRFYWRNGDLHHLAEAFFAMGNVVSICRLCFLLPITALVGPLQVMLERMMIDIVRWIFFILIFFVAFACSLFLIFSFFSTILQQQNTSKQSSQLIQNFSSLTINSSNGNCPDYFYELLDQPIRTEQVDDKSNNDNTTKDDNLGFCQQSSNYGTLKEIGPYPAIHYFGQSFQSTLLTTFFTLFGNIADNGIPNRGYELIALSCYRPDVSTYLPGFDTFVSNLGFILYGLFTFTCVTVLINTLIAMFEETIDDIDDRADIEWKFARSKLFMEYIRSGNSLPVPLNLCPLPMSLIHLFQQLKQILLSRKSSLKEEKQAAIEENSLHMNIGRIVNNVNNYPRRIQATNERRLSRKRSSVLINRKLTYKIVIQRIVKRFLLYYTNRHDSTNNKEQIEFREVKNDITSFRLEVSYQIDRLDETSTSLTQSIDQFNQDLKEYFHLDKIKQHLQNSTLSNA